MGKKVTRIISGVGTLGASEVIPGFKSDLGRRVTAGVMTAGMSEVVEAFGKASKLPSTPNAPAPVTTSTPAVQQAQADAIARRLRARGYTSTILKGFLSANAQGTGELK